MANAMRNATTTDIKRYLLNEGLNVGEHDFEFADEYDAFKYLGYKNNAHYFLAAFSDGETKQWYASLILVFLGRSGEICADYPGVPEFETDDPEEVIKYVQERCQV